MATVAPGLMLLLIGTVDHAAAAGNYRHAYSSIARLQSVSLQCDATSAQFTLQFSAAVHPRIYQLAAPARVVIDLPANARTSPLGLPEASGLVTTVRAAPHAGLYRLVLELRAPLEAAPSIEAAAAGGGYRLRVAMRATIAKADALTTRAVAPVATAAPAAPVGPAVPAVPAAPRVVRPEHMPSARDIVVAVDAGHGGDDPGASGQSGTNEKDVVLAIAQTLAVRLNQRPGMRAVLTRDSDRLIDLRERFERARSAHADLFVSIHADAVRDRSIAGASVYTLSYRGASSEAAKRLADHENALVLKGGTSLANVDPALASVLLDVSQEANMGASVEAADEVLEALDRVGAVRKKIVQHAAFVVLKSPDLPSMLVETAYISNPAEERKLRSRSYQEQLAAAIEAGVVAYFHQHPPDTSPYTARIR
jgi:N-acetylmuramoyl-L-alanine amidase